MPCKFHFVFLLGMAAAGSFAQLGQDLAACEKTWGTRASGELDAEGAGFLYYLDNQTSIELRFFKGAVVEALYRNPSMDQAEAERLLKLNQSELVWDLWAPPGIPATESHASIWLRPDDSAYAQLHEDALRIIAHFPEPEPEPPRKKEIAVVGRADSVVSPVARAKEAPASQKAVRPAELPGIGDERSVAIKMLGDPQGIMESGSTEILVYAWGSVWVAGNKVISVH
jgi:hypothetical protein